MKSAGKISVFTGIARFGQRCQILRRARTIYCAFGSVRIASYIAALGTALFLLASILSTSVAAHGGYYIQQPPEVDGGRSDWLAICAPAGLALINLRTGEEQVMQDDSGQSKSIPVIHAAGPRGGIAAACGASPDTDSHVAGSVLPISLPSLEAGRCNPPNLTIAFAREPPGDALPEISRDTH